jgi:hypothetical protein
MIIFITGNAAEMRGHNIYLVARADEQHVDRVVFVEWWARQGLNL